ncbi:receptor-like kinase TMK2 [Panicum miliaceum]|uniref:Receptor-like kinase TMK2 n=1 Tax=Panicum miliaceum TaxID=4540 RepID=A0A3L6SAA7_PANMI|nr:receptor-like kinase TMK2 [Panicum miliaceum]
MTPRPCNPSPTQPAPLSRSAGGEIGRPLRRRRPRHLHPRQPLGLVGWLHAPDLSKLTFLAELDLGFNALTGQTGGDLPLLPAPLQHLRALDLRSNRFLDVPDGFFAAFPALETINLDDNPRLWSFSANNISLSPFPDYLGSTAAFPALESLSLARNALHGAIPAGFGSNSNIKFLDLVARAQSSRGA